MIKAELKKEGVGSVSSPSQQPYISSQKSQYTLSDDEKKSGYDYDTAYGTRIHHKITVGSDTYDINGSQANWIRKRSTQDYSQYYTDSAEDIARKRKGIIPVAVEKTYGSSTIDKQLLEMGLPSSSLLPKYVEAYSTWYGDGSTYQFNERAKADISSKFKASWEYEYTLEDDARKRQGLPPAKIAAKYSDTYRDSQLMEQGMPPESMLSDYVGAWENTETLKSRREQFYYEAAALAAQRAAQNKTSEDAEMLTAFDELLSSDEWADMAGIYTTPPKITDDGTVDSLEEYEKKWSAQKKESKDSDEPTVSFADFQKAYPSYKETYLEYDAAAKSAFDEQEQVKYDAINSKPTAIAFANALVASGESFVDVLKAMYDRGVSLTRVHAVEKSWQKSEVITDEQKAEISRAFAEIDQTYKQERKEKRLERYSASARSDDLEEYQTEKQAAREAKQQGDVAIRDGIVKKYDQGATSTINADDAEKIFTSNLVYDSKGNPTDESIALATNMLYDAGASTSVVLEVGKRTGMKNGILSKDYAEKQKEATRDAWMGAAEAQTSGVTPAPTSEAPDDLTAFNAAFSDAVAERDLAQRKGIIDAAYKANVESGNMTAATLYNAFRRAGWDDAIDVEKDAESYYKEVFAPKYAENGQELKKWEEIDQAQFIDDFEKGKALNPEIHKTTEEIVRGSLARTFSAGIRLVSGATSFADMATAKISGRTDTWEFTKRANEAAASAQGVSSNQSFGSRTADIASTAASEIIRMYALSDIGSGVLGMFSKVAGKAVGAISRTNAGNILSSVISNTPWVNKGASAIVKMSKWLVQSSPFIADSMGSYYSEAMQNGATVDQAVLYGTVCGALEGATEALNTSMWINRYAGSQAVAKSLIRGSKSVLAKTAGNISKRALLINLMSSALGEGFEEMASYTGSWFMKTRTYDADAKFSPEQMFQDGAMGALIGFFGAGLNAGADTKSNLIAEFLQTKSGMEWAMGDGASAVRDLFTASVYADSLPSDVVALYSKGENALSLTDFNSTLNDATAAERQLEETEKKHTTDVAKIDAALQAKQDAVSDAEQRVAGINNDGSKEAGKALKAANAALLIAENELAIEQTQHDATIQERTSAYKESIAQQNIALEKAQQRIAAHSVSLAAAFRPEILQMAQLVSEGVDIQQVALGQQILSKMDAARAGKLTEFVKAQLEAQAQNAAVTAAEGAGAAQTPTGDNVVLFGQASQEAPAIERAFAPETAQPANVAMFGNAEPTAQPTAGTRAIESFNERATELDRQPMEFSKEEMPYVDAAVKSASSISAEIGARIKAEFPYVKSIVGLDYVSESMQDIALHVLNGDAEYLDAENLARTIESVIGTVRIDLVPTEVGLLGHDGNEIRDIRNQIRKTKISIGTYTATGFKYSVDDTIRTDKSLFGTIRLSKSKSAQSADALYYELSNAYPDLFDPDVINPSDQIRVMAEFVQSTYNGRAEALSKINSGEYVHYLAQEVEDQFVAKLMDQYMGVSTLRSDNGGSNDGNTGTVEGSERSNGEASGNSAEEAGRNEAQTGENASANKKVETAANPSETMGIVDPKLQETMNGLRRFGRALYKRVFSGAAGTERASRVQKKLGVGGVSIDASAQLIRSSNGTAQFVLGDALVDINGKAIGDSFIALFKDIPAEKWGDFQTYLLAKHTEARMTLEERGYGANKPVLASESGALDPDGNPTAMDATEAAALAAKLEAANPDFARISENYRTWWKNFMRSWAVDGGLMTETQFDALDAKYPDYVPTYRVDKNKVGGSSSVTRNSVSIASAIKNATGSTDEIQDIRLSLADMVKRYVTMERRNELVQNLYNFAESHPQAAAEFANIFEEESGWSPDIDFVSFDEIANESAAEVKDGQYIIRGFRDGERVSMHVSKDVYDAINYLTNPTDVSVRSQHENEILKGARAVSKPIKGVITGYNPFFALMNFARDAQTYFVNTNAKAGDIFINIGRAVSERAKNSSLWQSYLALGGNASGYITSQQMTDASVTGKGKVSNAVKKAGEIVGWLGGYTENMFRFAEYINGVNKYGDTAEGRRNAMADAADVTVNFSRSGAYTKAADAFCLYLNANVQGLDKMARTIANNPGRTALRGLSLAAIALLLRYVTDNDDNPHYQNLTNYVKDSSYCIPNVLGERDDNGYCTTFIKIPKSREYGTLIVATLERAARWADGSESFDDAFADLGKDIGTSIGIRMEPLWTAAQAVTTNKNYFGSDIVPMYMQDEAAPDQTTAQTSIISDAISERLYDMGVEVSPMVMDYIINQYGGFYGQALTSVTAKDASGILGVAENIVTDKFVADPLYQSGAVSRFYDAMDDAQYYARQSQREREALGIGTASVDEQYYDALGDYQKQLAALRKEERAILAKEDDTPERKAKIDKIREQINDVANAGLALWSKRSR